MNSEFFRHIFLAMTFLAFIMALGQLIRAKKNARNWLMAFGHFSLGAATFSAFNTDSNLRFVYPHLALYDVPFIGTISITLYVLVYLTANSDKKNKKWIWMHFLAMPIMFAAIIPDILRPNHEKAVMLQRYFFNQDNTLIREWAYSIALFVNLVYLWIMGRLMKNIWSLNIIRYDYGARFLVYFFIFGVVVNSLLFLGFLFRNYTYNRICALLIGVCLMLLRILYFRYPKLFEAMSLSATQSRKAETLQGIDSEQVAQRLEEALDSLYRDENLTLSMMSKKVNLRPQQLSAFINSHFKKNFHQFVNEYRVKKAEKLLAEAEGSVMQIAYNVGFNSRASFNRVFKNITQLTPSEYRKNLAQISKS